MLSPVAVFKFKVALIRACAKEGIRLVPGTRAYRKVGGVTVPVLGMGKPARSTLAYYQRKHGLPADGILNAPTRRNLIPPPVLTVGEKAVSLMESWAAAGWTEKPAGSNHVPQLSAFAASHGLTTWYQNMGWPWCAFAGMLALLASGSETARLGFAGKFNALYTVDTLAKAKAGAYGMRIVPASQCRRGLIGLLDEPGGQIVDHFVMTRGRIILGLVRTVEGNTSPTDAGSQDNGGSMATKIRRASTITFVEPS